jgi:hypothetical protein
MSDYNVIQTTLAAADCVDGDVKRSAVSAVASLPRRPAGIAETAPASAQHAVTAIRTLHVASAVRAALVLSFCSVVIKCHVFSGVLTGRQCTKLRAGHVGVRCPTGSRNAQATGGARITCYVGRTYTIQVNYSLALRVRACKNSKSYVLEWRCNVPSIAPILPDHFVPSINILNRFPVRCCVAPAQYYCIKSRVHWPAAFHGDQ